MDRIENSTPQPGSEPDEAFDRLVSADPAAGVEPDLTAIRSAVTASVASQARSEVPAGVPTAGAGVPQADVVDLAVARSRRRPARWLQVAAAAAGVVVVGTAGYAVGSQGDGTDVSAGAQEGVTVDLPSTGSVPSPGGPSSATGSPPESASSMADRSMIAPLGGGRTLFTAVGLGDAPGSASAWGYDSAAAFTSERAAAIAGLVGLDGTPALRYGAWHLGSTDWTGPTLDLQSDATTSFFYSDPSADPWGEGSTAAAVDAATATAQLTDMMTALGVDPAGYDLTVEDTGTPNVTTVSASRTTGSVTDGQVWQLSVSSDGIYSLSGALAPLVDLGSYDVVGPTTAVARLTDPRFGATADYSALEDQPMARADGVTQEMVDPSFGVDRATPDDPAAVPTLPSTPAPGSSFAWPVAEVAITGAELTTTTVYSADGSVALVPAYRLTGDDGSAWTVVAVTEAHLRFAAQG